MKQKMALEELDVTTLSAEDLRCNDAQKLQLEPNESVTLTINALRAYKTEYGIMFSVIGDDGQNTYSISSWSIVVTPRLENILNLKGKKVKITNTGAKKYKAEWSK